jgi:hypothetical protein
VLAWTRTQRLDTRVPRKHCAAMFMVLWAISDGNALLRSKESIIPYIRRGEETEPKVRHVRVPQATNPRPRTIEILGKNPSIREMAKRREGRHILPPQYPRKRCRRTCGFNCSGTRYSLYNSAYRMKTERSDHRYGVQYFDTTARSVEERCKHHRYETIWSYRSGT